MRRIRGYCFEGKPSLSWKVLFWFKDGVICVFLVWHEWLRSCQCVKCSCSYEISKSWDRLFLLCCTIIVYFAFGSSPLCYLSLCPPLCYLFVMVFFTLCALRHLLTIFLLALRNKVSYHLLHPILCGHFLLNVFSLYFKTCKKTPLYIKNYFLAELYI